jgi:hypothetical protein
MHFSPQIRKAIYAAAAGLVPLLVLSGLMTDSEAQLWLNSVAAGLAFFASMTAIRNVAPTLPEEFEDVDTQEFEDVTVGTEPPHIPGT